MPEYFIKTCPADLGPGVEVEAEAEVPHRRVEIMQADARGEVIVRMELVIVTKTMGIDIIIIVAEVGSPEVVTGITASMVVA